jgi:DNA mismatch repair protein MutL
LWGLRTGKIKILDKKTINKIAAGEVIERPASVVKELLENSIDANSTKIVVELELAGRKLIRVTDDGDGIPPEDLKLAFEKHSTSKITVIDDVYRLTTLGFRGEALASIAAVSRIECISCHKTHDLGRKVIIESGMVQSFNEIGCPKGTTIKIKDIFKNIPARYKYLKSDQTELTHIIEVITHLAIYHHQIGFRLIHNGKELLNFPSTKNRINNLVNIYGKELVRNLLPLSGIDSTQKNNLTNNDQFKNGNININGYISKPLLTRSERSYQTTYVNGRYVETRIVNDSIKNAYKTLVMKHRHPVAILFITIDPEAVDVNISPTKVQVRFRDENLIYNTIHTTIHQTLKSHDLIQEAPLPKKPQTITLKAITTFGLGKPGTHSSVGESNLYHQSISRAELQTNKLQPELDFREPFLKQSFLEPTKGPKDSHSQFHQPTSTLPPILPVGQIMDTYIIAQSGDSMLIIDQHAASERIMYEKIKNRYSNANMATQELLEPVELEFSPSELGLLKTSLNNLEDLNFVIDELGDSKYYVKGIPIILGRLQKPEFVHDIITDLISATRNKKSEGVKEEMIQVMACKAAIKAGKLLTLSEIQQLLTELYSLENPYTCAHGRPTIISLTDTQLKKLFKRIV